MSNDTLTLAEALSIRTRVTDQVIDVNEPTTTVVIFSLGDDLFAFKSDNIKEIIAGAQVFFLPGCPASLEGVINVRGDIESVISLRLVLGYPPLPPGAPSAILLARGATMQSGVRVDGVEEVLTVADSSIQAPPPTLADAFRTIVPGVLPYGERVATVLDLERIFDDYRAGLR